MPIQENLKKGLIFGFKARPPVGVMLSFLGYHHYVIHLLQMISHGTRAFIVNAEGLPGFIIKFDLKQVLIQADVSGELSSLQEH